MRVVLDRGEFDGPEKDMVNGLIIDYQHIVLVAFLVPHSRQNAFQYRLDIILGVPKIGILTLTMLIFPAPVRILQRRSNRLYFSIQNLSSFRFLWSSCILFAA